jgi:hypothetical protein
MNNLQDGCEGLAFSVRHWELLTWLEDHWEFDDFYKLDAALRKANFSNTTSDRIKNLCRGNHAEYLHNLIAEIQYSDAKKIVDCAVFRLRNLCVEAGFQCDNPKRKNARSNVWENEFFIYPKHKKIKERILSAGVVIDYVPMISGGKEVCLMTYLWLKTGRPAISALRRMPIFNEKLKINSILSASIEETWPSLIVLGASSIVGKSNDNFSIKIDELIEDSLMPVGKIDYSDLKEIYDYAGRSFSRKI